jgi:autotransporter-associated beta strand protein
VYDGTLALQRGASVNSPAIAVPGTLIIGISGGTNLQATVMDSYPEQIADTGPITINYACELALNGYAETIGPLTLNYGSIDGNFAGSLLKLNGDVTSTGDSPGTSVGCAISLGGATRTFTVGNGNYYLELNGTISDGGASAGLIKVGPGMLNSQVSNSYSGLTLIKDGLLIAADAHALGSTAAGTVVTNTGMLRLGGNFAVGAEPLTLSGFGFGYCSVYSDANSVSWAGPVTLASNTAVGVQNGTVTFSGGISGPGGFAKIYPGTVAFAGTNANTYAGTTTVTGGTLQLNKLGAVSVPGTLIIGDDLGGTNLVVVQCTQTNAIANAAAVTVNGSGTLNMAWLFGASDTIGSLSGSGAVSLGLNTLTTGGNNSNTNFSGTFSGFASAAIVKEGFGTWTLSGASSSYLGNTYVNAGKLVVNGSLGGSLQMNYLSSLGGTGAVGSVTGTLGHVGPGNSIGKISTGNFTLNNGSSSLDIQINGATPGSGYDQLNVAGTVTLSNPKLNVTPMFSGALGNQYVIIANDGADAITGTFLNLPEGTNFTSGGMQFMITYKGGDGNDVVLTQLSLPAPSHIGTVSKLGNGQMQISGTGLAGLTYDLQATTNLSTPNWTKIGTVQADTNGIINLTDPNVAQFPARFYRFKGN